MASQTVINADEYHDKLSDFTSEYDEFQGTTLRLDRARSFDDVAVFDVDNFYGDVSTELTADLKERFGGLVSLSFSHDAQHTRRKLLKFTVQKPSRNAIEWLRRKWADQEHLVQLKTWSTTHLLVLAVVALALLAHATYALHEHTEFRTDNFSVLAHFVTHRLMRLWLFAKLE